MKMLTISAFVCLLACAAACLLLWQIDAALTKPIASSTDEIAVLLDSIETKVDLLDSLVREKYPQK